MVTKKDRRHNGYVSPRATISFKDIIKYDLFINDFYDDWEDYRDGFRDWFGDFKLIKKIKLSQFSHNPELATKRLKMNKKQKILLRRRKLRKNKTIYLNQANI
ncbi:hypothetical protein J4449_04265 [Candidatus Woesearchaeota archaeon]|nr:hypothetical protein [Candidatus Woesearchaeota archaeon]